MRIRTVVGAGLALLLAWGPHLTAQQPTRGTIAGKATDEAKKPYSDYQVQLRDAATGQIVSTVPLGSEGEFTLANLPLSRRLLVELYHLRESRVICTEGPYTLAGSRVSRTDVNIDCGAVPAALWLLGASAGTAAAIALSRASGSR
jgi:hypothetical protein